jgi:PTH2 family peptidyl-tRNA hydrolase
MYKQVILVRQDLQLPKGKLAAQVAHAAVESYSRATADVQKGWKSEGQMKVVLKVSDEKELFKFLQLAKDAELPNALITDAGRTVIAPGTITVLGIGPSEEDAVDALTGHLSLL